MASQLPASAGARRAAKALDGLHGVSGGTVDACAQDERLGVVRLAREDGVAELGRGREAAGRERGARARTGVGDRCGRLIALEGCVRGGGSRVGHVGRPARLRGT
jgi:hypothetical protein